MHQCVKCGTLHEDVSNEILKGCKCGGKLFFFIKKENLKEAERVQENLTEKDKQEIEKDVMDIIGIKESDDYPVILDLESIKVLKPGRYDIDLVHLFKKAPLVYKLDEGKYFVDIATTFEMEKKNEDK
ncbi:MAG: hypothetical protein HYS32_03160 [Candidatus Woesearchaeota archaeon]|nr:MAG: hypothetical protein HYS32_03160 [Candidatus Woesearchaeota archaeon]